MFEQLFFKRRCEKFEQVKAECLHHFDKFGCSFRSKFGSISNTDWHVQPDRLEMREYHDYLQSPIEIYLHQFRAHFKYSTTEISNLWFQQYEKGDYHPAHTHGKSNFSSVLYMELPDQSIKTKFMFLGEEIKVDVREGDILTFPSFLKHESPVNNTDKRKTIVSFNFNIDV